MGVNDKAVILLLEDDEITTKLFGAMLQALGYAVETTATGEDALALYKMHREQGRPFAAVILDIFQPQGIGGKETMLRLLEYDSGALGIACSGATDDLAITAPKSYGFRDALTKPFTLGQLGSVLEGVIVDRSKEGSIDRRRDVRRQVAATFRFVVGAMAENICMGVTTDMSKNGFGFLTDRALSRGQAILVTKHDLPDIEGRKALVIWTKRESGNHLAGVEFLSAG
jgi:CheY-like chemotaxis protein